MTSRGILRAVSKWAAVILSAATVALTAPAFAEPVYYGSADPSADALEMLAVLEEAQSANLFARGGAGVLDGSFSPGCIGAIDLSASGWRCGGSNDIEVRWTATPIVSIEHRRQNVLFVCLRPSLDQQCVYADGNRFAIQTWSLIRGVDGSLLTAGRVRELPQSAYRAVDAIQYFAQRRTAPNAGHDGELVAILSSQTSLHGSSEELRRVQVQVETAIRTNRTIDAARLYRDALRTAPAWAEGRFNLGLLYGELELYPEAITEMRRYLHLAPNAADARAVQDRIYEWEALLSVP